MKNFFTKDIIPPNDAERVASLQSYNILDTPPEAAFDNLALMAATHFDVPIALISLVDKDHVFFKASVGMGNVKKMNRGMSLCSLAVLSDKPTVIESALEDPCLIANPLVHGDFGVRFYAGAPLTTSDGYHIGVVCLVDKKPRTFTAQDEEQLIRFSKAVMHEMEIRLAIRQKTEALEKETRFRQQMVTSAVICAQERDRSAIATELHDNVSQILTTVKLFHQMALDGLSDTKAVLERSSLHLQDCIDELRSLSLRLSAPTLGEIRLLDLIRELADSMSVAGKLRVTYDFEGLEECIVKQELYLAIYRILQEQLNNISRHAAATEVRILLSYNEEGLRLLVKDNGQGFDTKGQYTGLGITNMRTRAESLNGSMEISSAPGKGTLLQLEFTEEAVRGLISEPVELV